MELIVSLPTSIMLLPATTLLFRSVYPAPSTANPRQPGVAGMGSIASATAGTVQVVMASRIGTARGSLISTSPELATGETVIRETAASR